MFPLKRTFLIALFLISASISAQTPSQAVLKRAELYKLAQKVAVQISATVPGVGDLNLGSGVWISNRYIATCDHVVHGAPLGTEFFVQMAGKTVMDPKRGHLLNNMYCFSAR